MNILGNLCKTRVEGQLLAGKSHGFNANLAEFIKKPQDPLGKAMEIQRKPSDDLIGNPCKARVQC